MDGIEHHEHQEQEYEAPEIIDLGGADELVLGGKGDACDNQTDHCHTIL
jgi:hypothetical protein